MTAGDGGAGPLGRTDVSSLTEMVSLAMGDSGSGVGEAAAAGKQKMMSLFWRQQRWPAVHELKLLTKWHFKTTVQRYLKCNFCVKVPDLGQDISHPFPYLQLKMLFFIFCHFIELDMAVESFKNESYKEGATYTVYVSKIPFYFGSLT